MRYVASLLIVALMTTHITLAAEQDTFEIGFSVTSTDTSAPTAPTALTATAVSTSQIDLSWTASTDNVAVTGYQVFRNSTQIASSTTTTYSDTGLSENTSYSYTVTAFDAAENISAHSATATATTLSTPASSGGGGGGGGVQENPLPIISDLIINVQTESALITWKTNPHAIATFSWGETQSYESGVLHGALYLINHEVALDGLSPQTRYFFSIEVEDGFGGRATLTGEFTTLSVPLVIPPNVPYFDATPTSDAIELTWTNPETPDFDSVRVVRSDKFYPVDIFDGEVIYEGDEEVFTDRDVVKDVTYYYTLFTKNSKGEYSSGAVDLARISLPGITLPHPFDEVPQALIVHPQIQKLTLKDFDFIQNGKLLENDGHSIAIDGAIPLTISLKYDKVPEILKTIGMTLEDPEDSSKTFSFLLRVDETKSAYVATVDSLGRSGIYALRVVILDYKNQGLLKLSGELVASVAAIEARVGTSLNTYLRHNFLELLFLLLLIVLSLLLKRERDRTYYEYGTA